MQQGYKQHAWRHFSGMLTSAIEPMKNRIRNNLSRFALFAGS